MGIEGYANAPEKGKLAATSRDLTSLAKEIVKKNTEKIATYMKTILNKAQIMSTQKYTYGLGNNQYVCDTFVKKVLSDAGNKKLNGVYATPNIYKEVKPTEKLTFGSGGTLNTPNILPGSILFFVDKKNFCGHMAIFAGNKNGHPEIYDATPKLGVSKRTLYPTEADKIYYKNIV